MVKFVYQNHNPSVAIGLIGDKKDILDTFNLFYNWGGVDKDLTEPNFQSDTFALFYTKPNRFKRAVEAICSNRLAMRDNTSFKGKPGGFKAELRAEVERFMSQFTQDDTIIPHCVAA